MIVLGIDPGTARMGYGLISIEKSGYTEVNFVKADVLITHPDLEAHKRLKFLFNELTSLIKLHKPDVMVIEKLFFNTNAKTAIAVGQARGICLLAAANAKMDYFEYTALEAKFVLTGYGRSDKKQMQEAVKNRFTLSNIIKSDDANDAVAMAVCYLHKELLKEKTEVVKAAAKKAAKKNEQVRKRTK